MDFQYCQKLFIPHPFLLILSIILLFQLLFSLIFILFTLSLHSLYTCHCSCAITSLFCFFPLFFHSLQAFLRCFIACANSPLMGALFPFFAFFLPIVFSAASTITLVNSSTTASTCFSISTSISVSSIHFCGDHPLIFSSMHSLYAVHFSSFSTFHFPFDLGGVILCVFVF